MFLVSSKVDWCHSGQMLYFIRYDEQSTPLFLQHKYRQNYLLLRQNHNVLYRRITSLLLILAFLANTFSYYVFYADYYINKSPYIANCVNKDKPWMHCNGKCQLHMQIDKQQNNSDKQVPERKSGNDGPLACNSFFADVPELSGLLIVRCYPEYATGNIISMPQNFFHPPGNISA